MGFEEMDIIKNIKYNLLVLLASLGHNWSQIYPFSDTF